ncbi:MAG TPA: DUF362 domain-containing protein [Syntrophales bacterium]|jgi:hypothetical protein|nr:DUF362 domain-containing protein [Syntrophales bacterium]HPN08088.1 DUF362 domain-containing protein [Syntrophales bacterium]HQK78311.1 DUF362 domain-containing protein [Syntrophales bacterium]
MKGTIYRQCVGLGNESVSTLKRLLHEMPHPFRKGDNIGIKLHWGEKGNHTFLPPVFAREIVVWLRELGATPFVFDTSVLYSGSRRNGSDSLKTAAAHGYSEAYLDCPVVVADGLDGRAVIDIPAGYRHFETVQVADIFKRASGFVILSHFKGHMVSGFGGAIKNISMGWASRAQKQRMHSDARPRLEKNSCSQCGLCVDICPSGAAQIAADGYPDYSQELCIGCAQCIGLCPELALEICWNTDINVFQEKLVETAAAIWKQIQGRAVLVNAMLNIASECDCLPGQHPIIAPDAGFVGGYNPVSVDVESINRIGKEPFIKAHPHVDWKHQFSYGREIGFA